MADAKTEKQKVKEITDKLEEGLKELFESEIYTNIKKLVFTMGLSRKMCKFHKISLPAVFKAAGFS